MKTYCNTKPFGGNALCFFCAFLIFLLGGGIPLKAQFINGIEPGQTPATKVEKSSVSAGAISNDVNLFTGELSLSYHFGNVATLSGLAFPVQLSYNSTSLVSYNPEQHAGIPYGEGWNLSSASVSAEYVVFDHNPAIDNIPRDQNFNYLWTPSQIKEKGAPHFLNLRVQLPNGISGRLVYKYPHPTKAGTEVFILDAFGSYVEAHYNGLLWEVITDDGTVFEFSLTKWNWRNPTSNTATLDSTEWETSIPYRQPVRWMLTSISNPNHPQGQRVELGYHKFGKFNLHPELDQPRIASWLNNKGFQKENVYREIFLKSITALDRDGLIHSKVEFKYRSFRPENEFAAGSPELTRGKFLQLNDPKVSRIDSLFSKKEIWRDGGVPGFSNGWQRYQHPAAYQNPAAKFTQEIHPQDPFAARYNIPNSGIPTNTFYRARRPVNLSNINSKIPFTHSVLESPRINPADMPQSDLYELEMVVGSPHGLEMNFDVDVVSGVYPHNNIGVSIPRITVNSAGGTEFVPAHAPNPQYSSAYNEVGYKISSTQANLIKWNPVHGSWGASDMIIRNTFYLPNLPTEFEGLNIQVGPGSDNLKYADQLQGYHKFGYPAYFENNSFNQLKERKRTLKRSTWFGTGAPLEPQYWEGFFGLTPNQGLEKTALVGGNRNIYWYWPLNVNFSSGQVPQYYGPSQPTAVTREYLKSGLNPGITLNSGDGSFALAHSATSDAELKEVRLNRIGKNPWMLDSIVFYTATGEYGVDGLVPVSAYKLAYEVEQVKIPNNVNPLSSDTANATPYKEIGGTVQYRNIFQLAGIQRIEVDSTGNFTSPPAPPTTHIFYKADNPGTRDILESYLVDSVVNEIGGKKSFVYNSQTSDFGTNGGYEPYAPDKSDNFIGKGKVVEKTFTVSQVRTRDRSGQHTVEYQFSQPVEMVNRYPLDIHFQNGMNSIPSFYWKRGYKQATVFKPLISGPQKAKTVYIHHTDQNTWEDTLLFGRMIHVKDYDENGDLLSESKTHYHPRKAFFPVAVLDPLSVYAQAGKIFFSGNSSIQSYEAKYLKKSEYHRWLESWFVAKDSVTGIEYDPRTGHSITTGTKFTYYDWEVDTIRNNVPGLSFGLDMSRDDIDGDYERMYGSDALPVDLFNEQPYFHTRVGGFTYWHEPSWQLASATTTNSAMPGAWQKEEAYYLYDIAPFVEHTGFPSAVTDVQHTFRAYYLAKKYGVRNVPYEVRTTTYNGDPDAQPIASSQYYWYEVFRDVSADYIEEVDSSNYGRRCGGPNVVNGTNLIKITLDPGENVSYQRLSNEIADDPRWVQAEILVGGQKDTVWFYFPIDTAKEISYQEYVSLQNQSAGAGGYVQGPDGKIHYFGQLPLRTGGSIDAMQIIPAPKNYGKEFYKSAQLTDYSLKKSILLLDSMKVDAVRDAQLGTGTDSSAFEPPRREILTDVLKNQFFLRAIYVQADTLKNGFKNLAYCHQDRLKDIHNVFDTAQVTLSPYVTTPYQFQFRPLYPTIRTYYVHKRNMYGMVVKEEDVRHLFTEYEYSKPTFRTWWDLCGFAHNELRWDHPFKARSFTQTDYQDIEQTTVFNYYKDGSIKAVRLPNGETTEHEYDGFKRLTTLFLNGIARESHKYSQWRNNLADSWNARTAQNFVESRTFQTTTRSIQTQAFSDPMGRTAQAYVANSDIAIYTGEVEYDKWNRPIRTHRPYVKTSMGFDPNVPQRKFAESVYENSSRSRVLKSAATGRQITGQHVTTSDYKLITLHQMRMETGISIHQAREIFQNLNRTTFSRPGSPPPYDEYDVLVYRTESYDEDGKGGVSYTAAGSGFGFASLAFADAARTDTILTLMVPDKMGRLKKVIHPNGLETNYRRNFQGWPYEVHTPDAGLKKVMYNQAGDVIIYQDEALRTKDRYYFYSLDRMGRIYKEYTGTLSTAQLGQAGSASVPGTSVVPYEPLVYRGTPQVPFRSVHTIMDSEQNNPQMRNCDPVLSDETYTQLSFPCLYFPPGSTTVRKAYRFDKLVRAGGGNTRVNSNLIASQIYHDVWYGQDNCIGRLSTELIYDDAGDLHEMTFYDYDDEGNIENLYKQFGENKIDVNTGTDQVHKISYPDYDLQGKLRTRNIDIHADGKLDFQHHFEYDDFGRIETVYFNKFDLRSNGNKVVEYTYNDTIGLVSDAIYYVKSKDCATELEADHISYFYDELNRLDSIRSLMMDFDLAYDGHSPNLSNVGGVGHVLHDQNYNGSINGWKVQYKVDPYGVSDFIAPTVYGFRYDELNRLTDADATVYENKLLPPGAPPIIGYNQSGAYGQVITQTNSHWFGDVRLAYDKVGNITGLRRYKYFKPHTIWPSGGSGPNSLGENWTYTYAQGKNQLSSLQTQGMTPITFQYDVNGNLTSDSNRGLQGMAYNADNLPEGFTKSNGTQVEYIYGAGNARVLKKILDPVKGNTTQYYLREAGGTTLAILDQPPVTGQNPPNEDVWTFQLYGNGLIGEWAVMDSVVRDTTGPLGPGGNGGPRQRTAPENPSKGKKFFKKLGIHLAAAVPVIAMQMAMKPGEGEKIGPEHAAPLAAYPVFVELLTRAIDGPKTPELPQLPEPPQPELRQPDTARADTFINGIKFFIKDHLGNIRVAYQPEAVKPQGSSTCQVEYEVNSVMDYYPYGKHLRTYFASEPERYQTTEHERDAESGLDYRGARYYDSDYARFTGIDPLAGDFAGWSPYNYVMGNPVSLVDPDGMAPVDGGGGDPPFYTSQDGSGMMSRIEFERNSGSWTNQDYKWLGIGTASGIAGGAAIVILGPGTVLGFVAEEIVEELSGLPVGIPNVVDGVQYFAKKQLKSSVYEVAEFGIKETAEGQLTKPKNYVEALTPGNSGSIYSPRGGAYGKLDGQSITGYQKHHMPADAISPLSRYKGGAIQISPQDHKLTGSFGSSRAAKAYRAKQKDFIDSGDFNSAFQMDVNDIRSKFGNKYDQAIEEARNYYLGEGILK